MSMHTTLVCALCTCSSTCSGTDLQEPHAPVNTSYDGHFCQQTADSSSDSARCTCLTRCFHKHKYIRRGASLERWCCRCRHATRQRESPQHCGTAPEGPGRDPPPAAGGRGAALTPGASRAGLGAHALRLHHRPHRGPHARRKVCTLPGIEHQGGQCPVGPDCCQHLWHDSLDDSQDGSTSLLCACLQRKGAGPCLVLQRCAGD